jgi:uncharacterized protein with HEPN domain
MTSQGRRVPERMLDILDAIRNVEADVGDMPLSAFLADGKTQRAVLESLIVIGEAANRIMQGAPSLRDRDPALWQQLRDACDMRNLLTHEYFRIDASIVWTTIQVSLPPFKAGIESYATGLAEPPDGS